MSSVTQPADAHKSWSGQRHRPLTDLEPPATQRLTARVAGQSGCVTSTVAVAVPQRERFRLISDRHHDSQHQFAVCY
eukprot:1239253-Rhodomonas_salina.1